MIWGRLCHLAELEQRHVWVHFLLQGLLGRGKWQIFPPEVCVLSKSRSLPPLLWNLNAGMFTQGLGLVFGGQLELERCQIAASIPGINLDLLQKCSGNTGLENLPCLLWHIPWKSTQRVTLGVLRVRNSLQPAGNVLWDLSAPKNGIVWPEEQELIPVKGSHSQGLLCAANHSQADRKKICFSWLCSCDSSSWLIRFVLWAGSRPCP